MSVEFHYGTSSCAGIHSTKFTRSKSLFDIYIYIYFFCFTKYRTNENRKYYKVVLQLYKSVSFVPFLLKLITSK